MQKPQPSFHVRVQTGRGEQPLVDVWHIGVDAALVPPVTGSAKPDGRINFFPHLSIRSAVVRRRCDPKFPEDSLRFFLRILTNRTSGKRIEFR